MRNSITGISISVCWWSCDPQVTKQDHTSWCHFRHSNNRGHRGLQQSLCWHFIISHEKSSDCSEFSCTPSYRYKFVLSHLTHPPWWAPLAASSTEGANSLRDCSFAIKVITLTQYNHNEKGLTSCQFTSCVTKMVCQTTDRSPSPALSARLWST